MYEHIEATISGISPLLMHSARLANPLDPITRELKKVTAKRGKTDADLELCAQLEWIGGLYTTESGTVTVNGHGVKLSGFGVPCITGEAIEATLLAAAKKSKLGKQFSAGVLSDGAWPVIYDGPKDIATLSDDMRFRDVRRVSVVGRAIMRTRPIFQNWKAKIVLSYLPSIINENQVMEALTTAGQVVGLLDFRPKYGRFEVI
jgi:hypothetical protein